MNVKMQEIDSVSTSKELIRGALVSNKQMIVVKSTLYLMHWIVHCYAIPFRAEYILSHILCD